VLEAVEQIGAPAQTGPGVLYAAVDDVVVGPGRVMQVGARPPELALLPQSVVRC
jgi:hypothetical protein